MKISVLFAISLFTFIAIPISLAYAHPNHGAKKINRLTEKLSLNPEQQEQITQIFENARNACQSFESRQERKNCMREQNVKGSINSVLTPEQQLTFGKMRKRKKEP